MILNYWQVLRSCPAQQRSKQIGDVPDMKNEKLVYSAPSIKVSLVEEDILTWSETEFETGIEVPGEDQQ